MCLMRHPEVNDKNQTISVYSHNNKHKIYCIYSRQYIFEDSNNHDNKKDFIFWKKICIHLIDNKTKAFKCIKHIFKQPFF